jgi:hypothetical protein
MQDGLGGTGPSLLRSEKVRLHGRPGDGGGEVSGAGASVGVGVCITD